MTLEKIRAALPTHIMLTPGVHRWREGDEFKKANSLVWREISPYTGRGWPTWNGKVVEVGDGTDVRRPIPPHILDNQAWWVLYDRLGTVPPKEKGHILLPKFGGIVPSFVGDCFGERKFPDDEHAYQAVIHLGGDKEVIKRLTEGHLYDKWLLEQMEDV